MTDRQPSTDAVFVAILDGDKVLLQLRKNTGWLDGCYDLPSGHVEPGETFLRTGQREVQEETGLKIKEEDLELFHVTQHDGGARGPYTYLIFRTSAWSGTPKTEDPEKVGGLRFYPLNSLPEKTVPYVKRALDDITTKKVTFAYFGADGKERLS